MSSIQMKVNPPHEHVYIFLAVYKKNCVERRVGDTWQCTAANSVVTSIAYRRRKLKLGTFITLKYVIFKGEDIKNQIINSAILLQSNKAL